MKTLLVLAEHPDFAEAVRAGIIPEQCRVIHRTSLQEAQPLLAHGLVDACILDVEQANIQGLWAVEKLRLRAPKCPILVFTGGQKWDWEEEAYLQGVAHVLAKPVRPRLLSALLERLWTPPSHSVPPAQPVPPPVLELSRASESVAPPTATQALRFFRNFSGILTHSLNSEAMLKQFLLLLRELVGVNRAALFLRQQAGNLLAFRG